VPRPRRRSGWSRTSRTAEPAAGGARAVGAERDPAPAPLTPAPDSSDVPTVDCSHPLDADASTYPGDPAVSVAPAATMAADGYRVARVAFGSHAGTHVDAPAHTEPDGDSLGAVPVSRFHLDAVVVDCRDVGAREAIPPTAVPDHPAIDADGGPADPDSAPTPAVVFDTGWAERWGEPSYRDHPYLAPATARRCADRGLAVGIDAFSPDPSPPADPAGDAAGESDADDLARDADDLARDADDPDGLPAHRALLGADLPILENLRSLDALPRRVALRAYPLPIDADASPVRAVAEW